MLSSLVHSAACSSVIVQCCLQEEDEINWRPLQSIEIRFDIDSFQAALRATDIKPTERATRI